MLTRAETNYAAALVPPDDLTKGEIGPGEFRALGEHFLGLFRNLGNLAPTDRVLDVGCGSGRIAAPLTVFLDPARGSYEGFDITEPGVSWCQVAYRGHPNFRFRRASIRSDLYGVPEDARPRNIAFPTSTVNSTSCSSLPSSHTSCRQS